jgi:hypothetical protein
MAVRLEDLTPGAMLGGILADAVVTVVAVRWIGSNALQVTFRTDERLLYRDHDAEADTPPGGCGVRLLR